MSKTKVLVIEDESIVSKDIQHSLKRLGYIVCGAASTGEKAIVLAEVEKTRYCFDGYYVERRNEWYRGRRNSKKRT